MAKIREDNILKEASDIGTPFILLSDDNWLVDSVLKIIDGNSLQNLIEAR